MGYRICYDHKIIITNAGAEWNADSADDYDGL